MPSWLQWKVNICIIAVAATRFTNKDKQFIFLIVGNLKRKKAVLEQSQSFGLYLLCHPTSAIGRRRFCQLPLVCLLIKYDTI